MKKSEKYGIYSRATTQTHARNTRKRRANTGDKRDRDDGCYGGQWRRRRQQRCRRRPDRTGGPGMMSECARTTKRSGGGDGACVCGDDGGGGARVVYTSGDGGAYTIVTRTRLYPVVHTRTPRTTTTTTTINPSIIPHSNFCLEYRVYATLYT